MKIDWKSFESSTNIAVPVSFRRFADNILLGADESYNSNFKLNKVYDENLKSIISLGVLEILTKSELVPRLVVDRFISNDQIISSWHNAIQSDMLYDSEGLLPIGFLYEPVHTRLFLATSETNKGEIFIDLNEEMRIGNKKRKIKVSEDIWTLIEAMQENINTDLLGRYGRNFLYKRWGEDFWRVRDQPV